MNKALIVIDVQKYFLTDKTKTIVKNISKYLKNNSQKYSVKYFTIFKNDSHAPLWKISGWKGCINSHDIDICDEIKAFTNHNNLFYKNILSAAKVPQIIQGIKKNNISEVSLCGFDTDCCVLATAYDLFDQGIKPVVLENLTWSTSKESLHNPAIQILKRNIGRALVI
jgi:nicotinamidase-related amidase